MWTIGNPKTYSPRWAARLYAWSHVVWWGFHPSLPVSHLCHQLSCHMRAYACGVAASLRLQHATVVSRICYVWTHLIWVCAVLGNWVKALILKASLACDGGYYMWATTEHNRIFVNRRSLADIICRVANKKLICDCLLCFFFFVFSFLPSFFLVLC